MPVALKDLIDQAGRVTTCGSGFYRHRPTRSAPVVERLEAAGAVTVGRTGLHEFAYGFSSENPWFGPVRNPWDPTTSPGGSSGGSAVAVAAGLVPVAIGSDTGGSIRVPAALTGIFGLKVTHGRVPLAGVFPLAPSLDTIGPFAPTTSLLSTTYRVLAGLDDPSPRPAPTVERLRVGVPSRWVEGAPVADAIASFRTFLTDLESAGAVVSMVDDPALAPWGMLAEFVGAEAAHVHRPFWEAGQDYGEEMAGRLRVAFSVTPEQYLEAHAWRTGLIEAFAGALKDVDVLATPAVASYRKVIGEEEIGGVHYRLVLSWFSALVNHAGCPAIALPLTQPGAPPPSVQLIAPWWEEDRLLAISGELERLGIAGFRPPPGYLG
jgi:aspartyl-tRNA(Asn)/glutamyl-tRNA(Gln) amidotransferase subunit A